MKKSHFTAVYSFLIFVSLLISPVIQATTVVDSKFPADLTFMIADLKYSKEQGIKICEIQKGSESAFKGYDLMHGKEGLAADLFCQMITQYFDTLWFFNNDRIDPNFKAKFRKYGWKSFSTLKKLKKNSNFITRSSLPVDNPHVLSDYHGVIYQEKNHIFDPEDFRSGYPGVLLMDAATHLFQRDKKFINLLFSEDPALVKCKPKWKSYPKKYSASLAKTICQDFTSDLYVIKPLSGSRGFGVIIVDEKDLDSTLKFIFTSKKKKLQLHPDSTYNWWGYDRNDVFLVEEFIPSDPINVPHFNNLPYDPTLRVSFFLIYNNQEIDVVFLEGHWKLPKISLAEDGSLTKKHKSFGEVPHFAMVEPNTWEEIKAQLLEVLPILYSKMLRNEIPNP